MPLSYEPDPQDLALSSVPGQEMFDPRKRKFSAEELKPQPMIKKARKVFIPEDLKVNLSAPSPSVTVSVSEISSAGSAQMLENMRKFSPNKPEQ